MNTIFNKLNYKTQENILSLNTPSSFLPNLEQMERVAHIHYSQDGLEKINFILLFATQKREIDQLVPLIVPKLDGDAIFWIAYPKGSSKKYKCDFNRDNGWETLGKFGLEPVRQIANDEDWSALRFRNVKYIKSITHSESMALSQEAKQRITKKQFTYFKIQHQCKYPTSPFGRLILNDCAIFTAPISEQNQMSLTIIQLKDFIPISLISILAVSSKSCISQAYFK